jgi:translation elongation factor EF-4
LLAGINAAAAPSYASMKTVALHACSVLRLLRLLLLLLLLLVLLLVLLVLVPGDAVRLGRTLVGRMRQLLDRQQYEVVIQVGYSLIATALFC